MIGRNPSTTARLNRQAAIEAILDAEAAEFVGPVETRTLGGYMESGHAHNRSIYVIVDGERVAARNLRTSYIGD